MYQTKWPMNVGDNDLRKVQEDSFIYLIFLLY